MRLLLLVSGFGLVLACSGPAIFGCDDGAEADVEAGLASAASRWPDVADVVERLEVYCGATLTDHGVCGRAKAKDVEGCAAWPGTAWAPGRIYVDGKADDVGAIAEHQVQHLRPRVWALDDACADHRSSCWDF